MLEKQSIASFPSQFLPRGMQALQQYLPQSGVNQSEDPTLDSYYPFVSGLGAGGGKPQRAGVASVPYDPEQDFANSVERLRAERQAARQDIERSRAKREASQSARAGRAGMSITPAPAKPPVPMPVPLAPAPLPAMNKQSQCRLLRQHLMQKIAFEASYDDNYDSQQEREEDERLEAQEKIMQRLGLKGQVNFVGAHGNKPGIAVHADGKTAIDPAEQVALNKFLTSTASASKQRGGTGVTGAPPAAPVKPPVPMPAVPAPVKPPVPMPAVPVPVKPPAPMPAKPAPAPVKPVVTKPKGIPSGAGGGDLDDY